MKHTAAPTFYSKQPFQNDDILLIGWSGNQWDDISYFPKTTKSHWCGRAKASLSWAGSQHPVRAGQFFLVHPKRIHSGKPDPVLGWQVDSIAFKSEFVKSLFAETAMPFFESIVFEDAAYLRLFDTCFDLLQQEVEATLEAEGRLLDLILKILTIPALLPENQTTTGESEAVGRAVAFIEQHYKSNFSLDDLIEQAYLSKFHLIRVFKQRTGLTPHAYQMQLRLNEARRLIFKHKSLTAIAYELGFADQAHFTNTFKRYANGANPRQLLKTAISFNFEE